MPTTIGLPGNPIYNATAPWTTWSIHEIYNGSIGPNKYIPKINDYIIEPETGTMYIVTSLDTITFIPSYSPINTSATNQQIFIDALVTPLDDNYRLYYDKTTTPFTLKVDSLAKVYSSTSSYSRIYKGYSIDPTNIISRMYDNTGNYIGSDVPLELVGYNNVNNLSIKSIATCSTNSILVNGDIAIAVIYDSNGKVLSKRTLIVEETTYVAQAFAEQKYITNISIESSFIAINTPSIIDYPVNLPLESFNPLGVVHYNDGTIARYPIDNIKFSLYGIERFTSTIIGHKVPLVLSYKLGLNESAIANVTSDGVYVTVPYTLQVSLPNTSYNVKLYVYPVWVDQVNGYKYKAYLMNLDRNILIDVSTKLSLTATSPAFNPLLYGVTQRLTFSIELSSVSGLYNYFIYYQTVDIILRSPGDNIISTNFWEIGNQIPTTTPIYGTNITAKRNNTFTSNVNISNNITNLSEWLTKVYLPTNPLVNPLTEIDPLIPTHLEVHYLNNVKIIPIEDFILDINFPVTISLSSNIDIVFFKITSSGYLKLSVASMIVN